MQANSTRDPARLTPPCAAFRLASLVNATRTRVFNFLSKHTIIPQYPLQTTGGAYAATGTAVASAYLAYATPRRKQRRFGPYKLVLGDPTKLSSRIGGRRPSHAFSVWTLGQTTFAQNVKDLKGEPNAGWCASKTARVH